MTPGIQAAIGAAAQEQAQDSVASLPVTPGRILHVDGDYLAYFAAGNDDMPAGVARQVAVDRINKMQLATGSERVFLHLTHESSHKGHRYAISTVKPYQGNRNSAHPKNWAMLRDFFYTSDAFERCVWYDREADDGFAHATVQRGADLNAFATCDKDMRMLPGLHLDWKTFGLTFVPPKEYSVVGDNGLQYGDKWFALQLLQGDTADNCPGLPFYWKDGKQVKVGDKTAEKLLASCTSTDEALFTVLEYYISTYGSSDLGKDRFVEQAALMWLRRLSADVRDAWWWMYMWGELGDDLLPAFERLERRVRHAATKD